MSTTTNVILASSRIPEIPDNPNTRCQKWEAVLLPQEFAGDRL